MTGINAARPAVVDSYENERVGAARIYKTKAALSDLYTASNDLSAGDLADFHAMKAGRCPVAVFSKAFDETTYAIKLDLQVIAVGGHTAGGIWFVTTNRVATLTKVQRFRFYRLLKEHLAHVKTVTPSSAGLTNFVSVENTAHNRLLTKLGAVFSEGLFMAPSGLLLKQFWL